MNQSRRSKCDDPRVSANFRGRVVSRESDDYDDVRKVFNKQIDKRPELIFQCCGIADIIETLNYARSSGRSVVIRGGGHSVAGRSIVEDGLVIDLSKMRSVRVDPERNIATCEPGATIGDLDRESQIFGLATTGGIISCTGISGLILGGGLGWLMGRLGLSCDNLLSATVLLSNGKIIKCSDHEHADLFWALKGSGLCIGVVLEFVMKLHPVEKVFCGSTTFPFERLDDALELFARSTQLCSDDLTLDFVLSTNSSGQKFATIDGCHCGEAPESDSVLSGVRRSEMALSSDWRSRPYWEFQCAFDEGSSEHQRSYWKSTYLDQFEEGFAAKLKDVFLSAPSIRTTITIDQLHGAAARVPSEDTSFGDRSKMYVLLINSSWEYQRDDHSNIEWTRAAYSSLGLSDDASSYGNYLSFDEERSSSMEYNEERLRQVQLEYDPERLFDVTAARAPS